MKRVLLTLSVLLLLSVPVAYAYQDDAPEYPTGRHDEQTEEPAPAPTPTPDVIITEVYPAIDLSEVTDRLETVTGLMNDTIILLKVLVIGTGILIGATVYFIVRGAWEVS
jgi:hypothetical protein